MRLPHRKDVRDKAYSPIERIAGRMDAGVLLLCDHASNALPQKYSRLGLPAKEFERHIAYDIGAAGVVRQLAGILAAPALLTAFSRLLIDPNRGEDDPTLVMRLSDGALIPGNAAIDETEIERRRAAYWRPYRAAIDQTLHQMMAAAAPPLLISIHSFTPIWRNAPRIWKTGVLWDGDPRIAAPLLDGLKKACGAQFVGDNKPYDGALEGDTLNVFGVKRGLPHALLEIRQDLIAEPQGQREWAERLAALLRPMIADAALRRIAFYPSRAK